METALTTGKPEIMTDFSGNISITFRVDKQSAQAARGLANKLHGMKDKLVVTIKEYRNRRSLSANAYMWELLSQIAQAIGSDKDAVYLEMLRRYGKFTYAVVRPDAAEELKRHWRTADELEEVSVNGKKGRTAPAVLRQLDVRHKGNERPARRDRERVPRAGYRAGHENEGAFKRWLKLFCRVTKNATSHKAHPACTNTIYSAAQTGAGASATACGCGCGLTGTICPAMACITTRSWRAVSSGRRRRRPCRNTAGRRSSLLRYLGGVIYEYKGHIFSYM